MENYTGSGTCYDCLYMEQVNLFFSVLELAFTQLAFLVMSYEVSFSINVICSSKPTLEIISTM